MKMEIEMLNSLGRAVVIPRATLTYVFALAFVLCAQCSVSVAEDDPKALLGRLQERYDSLKDLEVSYRQEVHSGVFSTV